MDKRGDTARAWALRPIQRYEGELLIISFH